MIGSGDFLPSFLGCECGEFGGFLQEAPGFFEKRLLSRVSFLSKECFAILEKAKGVYEDSSDGSPVSGVFQWASPSFEG